MEYISWVKTERQRRRNMTSQRIGCLVSCHLQKIRSYCSASKAPSIVSVPFPSYVLVRALVKIGLKPRNTVTFYVTQDRTFRVYRKGRMLLDGEGTLAVMFTNTASELSARPLRRPC